ncbi:MAG: hypothetical protein ACOYT4_05215 [Nanoarchaeota archaeon]
MIISEFFVKGFLVRIQEEKTFLSGSIYRQVVFAPCGEKCNVLFVDTRTIFSCPSHPEEGLLIFSDRVGKFFWRKSQETRDKELRDKELSNKDKSNEGRQQSLF